MFRGDDSQCKESWLVFLQFCAFYTGTWGYYKLPGSGTAMNTLHHIYSRCHVEGAHPLHSHFISVLLNLLMSTDISGRYPNIKNIIKHDKNHDKSSCSAPWSCTVTAGKAGLRDRAEEQLFKKTQKTPPVFLDKHCLISRHCWFYLLPNYFHLSGHGSAAPAASWFNGKGGAPHTHTVQLIGQKT